jgi:hypothetical protein
MIRFYSSNLWQNPDTEWLDSARLFWTDFAPYSAMISAMIFGLPTKPIGVGYVQKGCINSCRHRRSTVGETGGFAHARPFHRGSGQQEETVAVPAASDEHAFVLEKRCNPFGRPGSVCGIIDPSERLESDRALPCILAAQPQRMMGAAYGQDGGPGGEALVEKVDLRPRIAPELERQESEQHRFARAGRADGCRPGGMRRSAPNSWGCVGSPVLANQQDKVSQERVRPTRALSSLSVTISIVWPACCNSLARRWAGLAW